MKKKISLVLAFVVLFASISFGIGRNYFAKAQPDDKKQETSALNPIHKYTFDNDNGDVVVDTGSLAGTDGKFNGKANGAKVISEDGKTFRRFNGTSDHIKINDSIIPMDKFSIKFSIKDNDTNGWNKVFENTFNTNGLVVQISPEKKLQVIYYSNNSAYVLKAGTVNKENFDDFLITYDGKSMKVYQNDFENPIDSKDIPPINKSSHNLVISGQVNDGNYFRGDIDYIEIYGDSIDNSKQAESITLDKTSMDLIEGSSDKITATILPESVINKEVLWSSSDESIATVDEEGNVTAVKEGQATITAKVENTDLTATCTVNVKKPVEENKNNAILSISLVNGATKEYDVSMEEVDKFINWFEERSNGKGTSTYSFDKKVSPYKSVKEYIVHDKIASFEVREYEVTE